MKGGELSPPSRRRGLKYFLCWVSDSDLSRLLHGGVDWNDVPVVRIASVISSPPSRRRGLKLTRPIQYHLTQRRLLHGGVDWNINWITKNIMPLLGRLLHGGVDWNIQSNGLKSPVSCVASFVEAWIEITWGVISLPKKSSPPSRRRGLKYGDLRFVPGHFGRLLHGGVDWNQSQNLESYRGAHVASFTEAWIEIGNPHCSSRCCYIVSSQR